MTTDLATVDDRKVPRALIVPGGRALFTWAAWLTLLAMALVYVRTFGKNLPVMDEWNMIVPFLTDKRALMF
jgi:hypothetical protein